MKKGVLFLIVCVITMFWACTQEEFYANENIEEKVMENIDPNLVRQSRNPILDYSKNEVVIQFKTSGMSEVEKKEIRDHIEREHSITIKKIEKSNYYVDLDIELWTLDFLDTDGDGIPQIDIETLVTEIKPKQGSEDAEVEGDFQFWFDIQKVNDYKGHFTSNMSSKIKPNTADVVNIAILDTGIHDVFFTRPFLYNSNTRGLNLEVSGWDFVDGNNKPLDNQGHGTYVASIITEILDRENVNYSIMPVKAFNEKGRASYFDIVKAMAYIAQLNERFVVNCSFGFYKREGDDHQILKNIIEEASNRLLIVSSAGNNGVNTDDDYIHYPSGYNLDNILSIGGYEEEDSERPSNTRFIDGYVRAEESNYGRINVDALAEFRNEVVLNIGNDKVYEETVFGTSYSCAIASARSSSIYFRRQDSSPKDIILSTKATMYVSRQLISEVDQGKVLLTDYKYN